MIELASQFKSPDPFMFVRVLFSCEGIIRNLEGWVKTPDDPLGTFLADMLDFSAAFSNKLPAMVERAANGAIERL